MEHGSIIIIQRPNRNPYNGNTRGPLHPRNFLCNYQAGKTMSRVFWDSEAILLLELMPHKTTIAANTYASTMVALRVLEIGLIIFSNIFVILSMIQHCAIGRSLSSLLYGNGDVPFPIRNYMLHSALHNTCSRCVYSVASLS